MFDTHCHLNFGAFDDQVDQIIKDALNSGISQILIPSTDLTTA
ncbi:TatD family hydrolase, partial [Candidatus Woesebacteria bacterium]|nr:TatD family hydrolase [Candidatus Woesebacteria bacterium]